MSSSRFPVGGEPVARAFYVGVLGMEEVPKPPVMAARGGAWFTAGAVQVHVGSQPDFVPARKAHPALLVRDLRAFIDETGSRHVGATRSPAPSGVTSTTRSAIGSN